MPKRICPRCGGNNTAKILWGMPMMSEQLEKDLAEKKVVLGGCCISVPTARYHCFDCETDILFDTVEAEQKTVYFELEIGGFFAGYPRIEVSCQNGNYTAKYFASYRTEDEDYGINITPEEYQNYIHGIYASNILEWDEEYVDPGVLDGTQWTVTIKYSDGEEIKRYGSNAYPPLWKKFMKAVNAIEGLPHVK